MHIFVSWSGDRSKLLALALRDWLPEVIQQVECFVSAEDIEKGTQWRAELNSQLAQSKEAIVCVTPENQFAPWLNFEAGALTRPAEGLPVRTLLFSVDPSQVSGPLALFQHTEAKSKEDMRRFLDSINNRCEPPLNSGQLDRAFARNWEAFEAQLQEIEAGAVSTKAPERSTNDLLTEVLELVRGIDRRSTGTPALVSGAEISQLETAFVQTAERRIKAAIQKWPPGRRFQVSDGGSGEVVRVDGESIHTRLILRFDGEKQRQAVYACFSDVLEEEGPPL